jgi:ribonuclease P protein component
VSAASPEPASPRPHRFGRSLRLHGRGAFDAVFAAKMRRRSGPLLLFGRPHGGELSRLGLSVGRRVGNAVTRHRLKRLLREAFRTTRSDLPKGLDLLVVVQPHAILTLDAYREHLHRAAWAVHRAWRDLPPASTTLS